MLFDELKISLEKCCRNKVKLGITDNQKFSNSQNICVLNFYDSNSNFNKI